LFLAGAYDTNVRSLGKPKLKNNAWISGLFFLTVLTSLISLVKRKSASLQFVKEVICGDNSSCSMHVTDNFDNSKSCF
jgi:hypothetical protein